MYYVLSRLWAMNLSILAAGILIMMQQVRLMMFSLNMVDPSMSFLFLSTWIFLEQTSWGAFWNFLTFGVFYLGPLLHASKLEGGWVVSGLQDSIVNPSPLGFILGLNRVGVGPGDLRVWD